MVAWAYYSASGTAQRWHMRGGRRSPPLSAELPRWISWPQRYGFPYEFPSRGKWEAKNGYFVA